MNPIEVWFRDKHDKELFVSNTTCVPRKGEWVYIMHKCYEVRRVEWFKTARLTDPTKPDNFTDFWTAIIYLDVNKNTI